MVDVDIFISQLDDSPKRQNTKLRHLLLNKIKKNVQCVTWNNPLVQHALYYLKNWAHRTKIIIKTTTKNRHDKNCFACQNGYSFMRFFRRSSFLSTIHSFCNEKQLTLFFSIYNIQSVLFVHEVFAQLYFYVSLFLFLSHSRT